MRWYEYKMEVDDVHAPDDLKEKLLAMQKARQAEQAASGTTPKPQLIPAPAPEKKKKAPLRFPVKRAAELAACVALCGVCLYGAALSKSSWNGVTLFSGGSAPSTAAAYDAAPELATYSLDGGADTYGTGSAERAVRGAGSADLLTSGNVEGENSASGAVDSAKIIYTAYLSIETKDFDGARQQLDETLDSMDGYMESSNEYTDSTDNTRTLSLTLRVPESAYSAFLTSAEAAGSVISRSESADDVIDVFDPEPPAKDNPLLTLDNVIVTPHLAGLARNGLKRIGTFVCEELTHFLNGETVRGEVTREMLARMA